MRNNLKLIEVETNPGYNKHEVYFKDNLIGHFEDFQTKVRFIPLGQTYAYAFSSVAQAKRFIIERTR